MKKILAFGVLCMMAICTLTMVSCKTEGGTPQQYSVTVTDDGNGKGIASPVEAEQGTAITIMATPKEGYNFDKWTVVSGSVVLDDPAANSATFTMPAEDVEIRAEFAIIPVIAEKYTVTVTDNGYGQASASVEQAEAGEEVTLAATAVEGGYLIQWTVVSGSVVFDNPTANPATFTMPAEDVEIMAEFVDPDTVEYTISISSDPDGYASASAVTAFRGEKITITATPNGGSYLNRWKVISGSPDLENAYANITTFTMPAANVEIMAEFSDDLFTYLLDAVLKHYCRAADTNNDGILLQREADNLKEIKLASADVESVYGIFVFPNLEVLNVSGNSISEIDTSQNKALKELSVGKNNLTSLNVSQNPALEILHCFNNEISTLNVSGATKLFYLDCSNNKLTNLNLSTNKALETVYCNDNEISNLNVNGADALSHFICNDNNLSVLYVGNNDNLVLLECQNNRISELDMEGKPNLIRLNFSNNNVAAGTIRQLLEVLPMRQAGEMAAVAYGGTNPGTPDITDADTQVAKDKNWDVMSVY